MSLTDARAILPGLLARPVDRAGDRRLLIRIAAWCRRFTPLIGLDGDDGLIFDITGCAHLFGGEAEMARKTASALQAQGFSARSAIAGTPVAATALARFSPCEWLPPGGEADFIPSLPVAALRCGEIITQGLLEAGLRKIGDLVLRPRAPLAARFGPALLDRLDEAMGGQPGPITPLLPAPLYLAERCLAEPVIQHEAVLCGLASLTRELARQLERHGEGALHLEFSLFGTNGEVKSIQVRLSQPCQNPDILMRLFKARFSALDAVEEAGFGYDVMRLAALAVTKWQADMPDFKADRQAQARASLIDRLSARLGTGRIQRLALADRHLPEAASPRQEAQENGHVSASYSNGAERKPRSDASETDFWPSRPIRLLARPEPVEAIAMVPDGPPLRFRWRRMRHEVTHAEGPERIASEWWRAPAGQAAPTRDYFRIESQQGERFWLYREGLFGTESAAPRWFLHGFFV